MLSAVFITDLSGKPLISRNYRGDIPLTSAIEKFASYLLEVDGDLQKPVFHVDSSGDFVGGGDMGCTGAGGETFVYVQVRPGDRGRGCGGRIFAWPRAGGVGYPKILRGRRPVGWRKLIEEPPQERPGNRTTSGALSEARAALDQHGYEESFIPVCILRDETRSRKAMGDWSLIGRARSTRRRAFLF